MLSNIELNNFKAFKNANIKLANLNLLTGINGLGKSSIIQALLLIRQSYKKGLFPNKGILLNGELLNIGKGSDALNIHSELEEIGFDIYFQDKGKLEILLKYQQDSDFLPIKRFKNDQQIDLSEFSLFNDNFKYLSAERISPKSVYNVSLFEVDQNRSLGIHGEHTSLFISRYQREPVALSTALHPLASSENLLDQVSSWLGEIAPGVSIKSQYFPTIDAAKFSYQYEYGNILTPEFLPNNVGFGLTYVLPVLTSILSSKPGDLIIIENPESHLHPAGQSKLGELLFSAALSNVQIIIETHSDHILNGIRVAINKIEKQSELVNVLFFERDSNPDLHLSKITNINIDDHGKIDNWPDHFFDQSIKDLNFLLGL